MSSFFSSDNELLRAEIAAAAARLIAEDGVDYATAKRKAARQILGNTKVRGDFLPDNGRIEDEVRAYNELFFSETQPARLLHLRTLAVRIMEELQSFQPYLAGAVLNGTAGAHSDIHLHLFAESAKEVEIFLLNKGIDFDVAETARFNAQGDAVETLSFLWQNEGVHLTLYEPMDLRQMKKSPAGRLERASLQTVRALIHADTTADNAS